MQLMYKIKSKFLFIYFLKKEIYTKERMKPFITAETKPLKNECLN